MSRIESNLIFIEGGNYFMGDTYSNRLYIETVDFYKNLDLPTHQVSIDSFYLNKYLTTFNDFDEFNQKTGKNEYYPWILENKNIEKSAPVSFVPDKTGVKIDFYGLNLKDIFEYCNWLSQKENLPPAYFIFNKMDSDAYLDGSKKVLYSEEFYNLLDLYYPEYVIDEFINETFAYAWFLFGGLLDSEGKLTLDITKVKGYRLPTDAEWEYAARGGDQSQGYKYSGSNNIDDVAVYYKEDMYYYSPQPIKTKLPNELGLYDMSGNVAEICQDYFYLYSEMIRRGWNNNPVENILPYMEFYYPTQRVVRGSPYYKNCNISYRMNKMESWTGFRVARSI